MSICYCGNTKTFAVCCEPFITLKDKPKSVRQLVRARYTAYALGAGKYREFLVRTWHPASVRSVSIQDLTNDIFTWKGLQIIQASQQGDYGKVEFKAKFSENDGADNLHHERSIFQRINGVWLYVEGEVRTG